MDSLRFVDSLWCFDNRFFFFLLLFIKHIHFSTQQEEQKLVTQSIPKKEKIKKFSPQL